MNILQLRLNQHTNYLILWSPTLTILMGHRLKNAEQYCEELYNLYVLVYIPPPVKRKFS